jgi:hypothetical protein
MRIGLIALILASVCAVAEGAVQGNFYPVQGPLASRTPPPVFSASFKGDLINPESLSAVLAGGEAFKGKWISVTTGKRRFQDAPVPPQPELKAAWDAVYGQGFFVAHILGAQFFERTILTGSKGTVLQVEIYRRIHEGDGERYSGPPLDIQGVAQDDKGNIYKVVF